MTVACCLALGGMYFLQSLDAYRRVKASLQEVERFNAVVSALSALSAERAPANMAMAGSTNEERRLSSTRGESDKLLAEAEAALVGSPDEAELLASFEEVRARLTRSRRLVDGVAAIKFDARSDASIASATDAMFMAFDSAEFIRDRLGQNVIGLEPALSSQVYLAIAASTFRDQLGRLAAYTIARLRPGSQVDRTRDQRFYTTVGRLLTIRNDLRNFAASAKSDEHVEAVIWRVDHELYSVAIPRTALLYRESEVSPATTVIAFSAMIRGDIQKVQTLREMIEAWSYAKLVAMRDRASSGVVFSVALTLLGALIVVMMSLALRRLLFAPLMMARAQIAAITNGDLSEPKPMSLQSPEMQEMFQGLSSLRDEQRFRRELEADQRRMADQLRRLSETDMLTGLLNRRALEEAASTRLRQADETGEEVGLILFDIDHFKTINDARGHAAGDAVLQAVATGLRRCLPRDAVFARFGGEEFVVVLWGDAAGAITTVADRLRVSLRQLDIATVPGQRVTASFGVVVRESGSTLDLGAMLTVADHRLYIAKRNGRDQVCAGDQAVESIRTSRMSQAIEGLRT